MNSPKEIIWMPFNTRSLKRIKIQKKQVFVLSILLFVSMVFNVFLLMRGPHIKETIVTEEKVVVKNIVMDEVFDPIYDFSDEEIYLMAQLLCGSYAVDGDGEYDIDYQTDINYKEVSKVLSVVMNRVHSAEFPNNVTDVIMQKYHFSVMPENSNKTPSEIALKTVSDWCAAYERYGISIYTVPKDHLYFTGNGLINVTRASFR